MSAVLLYNALELKWKWGIDMVGLFGNIGSWSYKRAETKESEM